MRGGGDVSFKGGLGESGAVEKTDAYVFFAASEA